MRTATHLHSTQHPSHILRVATVLGLGLLGYPLGLHWVRRSRYGITAGDIRAVATSARAVPSG